MLKKYKHSVLTDDQIKWIVKQKIEGKLKNEEIAAVQGISVRRVQQIYSLYKKNGSLPILKKAGRHKASVPEKIVREVLRISESLPQGVNPIVGAGVSLYLASKTSGHKLRQFEITEVFEITDVGLCVVLKRMTENVPVLKER